MGAVISGSDSSPLRPCLLRLETTGPAQLLWQSAEQAPVLLRLVFHDAGTHRIAEGNGGANGSIRYELDRPENYGLNRGWRVISDVMTALKGTSAEGRVSLADLVYLGGAYAVAITGGPSIEVPIGNPAISGS